MNEVVVADSTVLIYLGKLGNLDYLDDLFEGVLVPEAVYDEVVTRGRKEQYADALPVEEAESDFLDVCALSDETQARADEIRQSSGLGRGECTAIALAEGEDVRCLTDDHAARKTAASLGAEVGGTIYVLLEALERKQISFEEYVAKLDDLTDNSFRMSASLYRRAVEAGEEFSD